MAETQLRFALNRIPYLTASSIQPCGGELPSPLPTSDSLVPDSGDILDIALKHSSTTSFTLSYPYKSK